MKKAYYSIALAAAAITGCTSEDVMAPAGSNGTQGAEQPIAFVVGNANMSRTLEGLQVENYDFGVWAYKTATTWSATTSSDTGVDVVMHNYLVGYYNGNASDPKGYEPIKSQALNSSNWYYEALGSGDAGYTWHAGVQTAAHTSGNANQYLKYWDLSKTYVDFYACSPYGIASFANNKMTFNAVVDNDDHDVFYGSAEVTSASGAAGGKVMIPFKRLNAKIRLSFYSDLKGYNVQIVDFQNANDGIICMAATKEGTTYTAADGTNTGYIVSGKPTVTFTSGVGSIDSWTDATLSNANIVCPLWWNAESNYSGTWSQNMTLPTSYANRMYGGLRRVVPSSTNCGFTVNVSFKLTATDTGEVIYVYGAKVYVANTYTAWEPNKIYTYVFKITDQLPGTTSSTKPEPGVTPSDPALFPIVFDNVTIEDMTEVTKVPDAGAEKPGFEF